MGAGGEELCDDALRTVMQEELGSFTYLPQAKKFAEWRTVDKPNRLEAATHSFQLLEGQLQKESKRAKKLEDKLERVLGGYMGKAKQSFGKVGSFAEERETIAVEIEVFHTLAAREEKAIESRVQEFREMVEREKTRNSRLQQRYKGLKLLQKRLEDKLE